MSRRPILTRAAFATLLFVLSSCAQATGGGDTAPAASAPPTPAIPAGAAVATLAGGCFWCMEPAFAQLKGVYSVTSGYSGGTVKNPSYEQVSSGRTGHAESVQIVYDPARIGYDRLLRVYWHNIDPVSAGGQFCDRGTQYRSAIFYHDSTQHRIAEASKAALEKGPRKFRGKIVTEIAPFTGFYPAEEYHQDYHDKEPIQYQSYRQGCGRDRRLRELWGADAGIEGSR